MNDFLYPSNSKIYEKEPRYNKTSVWRTNFASPLALHYIEVPTVPVFGPSLQKISFVRVYSTSMVATGQEIVRGNKISSRSGKSHWISLGVRENLSLWKKSEKSEILMVHSYNFTNMNYCVVLVECCLWNWTISWCWVFKKKSILFAS